ncbi:MAG: VOC family protein [Muribaculaceae bacterium]|nr:VOC family protein [Muribaculaceae bacterium]
MQIQAHFDHFNINVMDLETSIEFYKRNLGLSVVGEKYADDGSFILKYLSSPGNDFRLELTWLRDHKGPYELGENESHLALCVAGDYDKVREFHRTQGVICYENPVMGIYFIHDPDDYWIEILPEK